MCCPTLRRPPPLPCPGPRLTACARRLRPPRPPPPAPAPPQPLRLARIKPEPAAHQAGYLLAGGRAGGAGPHPLPAAAGEPDASLLADVGGHLDVKEALLAQLKRMNAHAERGLHLDASQRPTADFQRQ